MNGTDWIKAVASQATGNCVEMRRLDDRVQIRDSKNPTGALLESDSEVIRAWLVGAKRGEFDSI